MTVTNKAILFSIIAAFALSAMTIFAKQAAIVYSSTTILFYRFLVTGLYASAIIFISNQRGARISIATQQILLHILRAMSASISMFLFFYSLNKIPAVTVNVLNLTHPLFSLLIASFLVKERASSLEVLLCCAGFVGVIFILQPSMSSSYNLYALYALMSGFFTSISIVGVRKLSKKEHPYSILLYNSLLSLVFCSFFLSENPMSYEMKQFFPLLMVGLTGAIYQDFIIRALSLVPAQIPSSMMYLSIVFSLMAELTISDNVVNISAAIGIVLIAMSGITLIFKKNTEGLKNA